MKGLKKKPTYRQTDKDIHREATASKKGTVKTHFAMLKFTNPHIYIVKAEIKKLIIW